GKLVRWRRRPARDGAAGEAVALEPSRGRRADGRDARSRRAHPVPWDFRALPDREPRGAAASHRRCAGIRFRRGGGKRCPLRFRCRQSRCFRETGPMSTAAGTVGVVPGLHQRRRQDLLPWVAGAVTIFVLLAFLVYPIATTMANSFAPAGEAVSL